MKRLRLGYIIVAAFISYYVNTYYLDNLLKIFNIISIITLLINRICLAVLIYLVLDLIIFGKKVKLNLLIYKFSIIYFFWLFGILFGRIESNYSINSRFNFRSVILIWINYLDNKLVFYYLFGNILIYIPIGLIFRYFKSFVRSLGYCIILIIILETLQALTRLGFFDIDDIILNCIGSIIGVGFMDVYKKNSVKHI